MKQTGKNRFWVPALMIVSLLLLTAFVVQWLGSQYFSTRAEVEKDVRADLKKTSDQLLDSLLSGLFTLPLTREIHGIDTLRVDYAEESPTLIIPEHSSNRKPKTIINISMKKGAKFTRHIQSSEEIRTVLPDGESSDTFEKKMIMVTTSDSTYSHDQDVNELITKGLSVFIKKLSAGSPGELLKLGGYAIDTALCKRLLSRNWQHKGLNYKLALSPSRTTPNHQLIFAENPVLHQRIGVTLDGQRGYLLWLLLPQFLFAFFLVVITTLAFWLTYRSLRKQRQLYELRTDFVNNISHELKTPVSTVKVAVEALQQFNRRHEPEVMEEYLQLMKLEMNRLDKLINQVLTNAVMDSEQAFLQLETVDLVQLVNDILSEFRWQLNHAQATIDFTPSEASAPVSIDRIHVEGVILNLLDNCLKYAGQHPQIHVSLQIKEQSVELSISDNGPGIPPQYLKQLFDKFFRVPTGNEHNVKGYGLGLSYSRQVMTHHKGSISVENLPGKGCRFTLTFPKP